MVADPLTVCNIVPPNVLDTASMGQIVGKRGAEGWCGEGPRKCSFCRLIGVRPQHDSLTDMLAHVE